MIRKVIKKLQDRYENGAPREKILDYCENLGLDRQESDEEIQQMRTKGQLYTPSKDYYKLA